RSAGGTPRSQRISRQPRRALLEALLHPASETHDQRQRLSHRLQIQGHRPMSIMDAPPRETTLESGGYLKGVGIGVVTQNKDPEGLCRVKVRFPRHEKQSESYW